MIPNPEIISQSPESEADKNLIKILFLAVLAVAASFLGFYWLDRFILTASALNFWLCVLAVFFLLALNILNVFLIKSRLKLNLIVFAEAASALAVFSGRLSQPFFPWLGVGAAVFFDFLSAAVMRGNHTLTNSLKVNFWPTARAVAGASATGLLVLMTVVFYLHYFQWGNFNDVLGRRFVDGILASADPILNIQFPGASFTGTTRDLFARMAETELKKISLNSLAGGAESSLQNFNLLSPSAKQNLINEVARELRKRTETLTGPLSESAPVNVVIYDQISRYVSRLSPNTLTILGFVAALLLFFALKGFAALFYWLVILFAFVVFKFLVVIGFAYVNLETRSREYIMLS